MAPLPNREIHERLHETEVTKTGMTQATGGHNRLHLFLLGVEPHMVSSQTLPRCWFSDEEKHNAGTAVFTSSFTLIIFVPFSNSGNIKTRPLFALSARLEEIWLKTSDILIWVTVAGVTSTKTRNVNVKTDLFLLYRRQTSGSASWPTQDHLNFNDLTWETQRITRHLVIRTGGLQQTLVLSPL